MPPLQRGESDAKCLFSNRSCQSLTSKLANVRPWDERRRQRWLTSWPKNNKHNKDARDTAQGGHFVCLNSKHTCIFSNNRCHRVSSPSWGKSCININKTAIKRKFKWDVKNKCTLTSKLYSSTVLLSGSTICQQMRMHKSMSSIPPTMINNFWSFMIWRGRGEIRCLH